MKYIDFGEEYTWRKVFYGCTSLAKIDFHDNITLIGAYTFSKCNSLKTLKLPKGLTVLGASSFRNSTGLEELIIPNNVTSLDYRTFLGCTSLKTIVIPKSITYIDENIFFDTPLENIYYTGTKEQWNAIKIETGNIKLTTDKITYNYGKSTISYDTMGGSFAPSPQQKEFGEDLILSYKKPYKENYIFVGWSTTQSGPVEYKSKDLYKEDKSVTLYAVWRTPPVTTVDVKKGSSTDIINISVENLDMENILILVIYKDGAFAGIRSAIYEGEPVFMEIPNDYSSLRLFIWNNFDELYPLTNPKDI